MWARSWEALKGADIDFFPLRHFWRGYNRQALRADFIAGLNGALLTFPQAMAYALIAGLPVTYGLWGAVAGCVMGALFTRSPYLMFGPSNASAVLLLSAFLGAQSGWEPQVVLPLLLVMVAVFLVLGAWFRVASLIQYVSRSVLSGYITAAALLIIANQVQHTLGFRVESAATFVDVVVRTFQHLPETQWSSLWLSIVTISTYVLLRRWAPALPHVAVTLVLMAVIGEAMRVWGWPVAFIHADPAAMTPRVTIPRVSWIEINQLASVSLALTLLCTLETVSIGKAISARAGSTLNYNQEMFALGMANLGNAFLGGMPASGSPTRSSLNWTSGARTPHAQLFCGLICLGGLLLFGPLIDSIPKAALAVLVIVVGVSLINPRQIMVCIRSTADDRAVFLATLGAAFLFPFDFAIYFGVVLSIILFLRKASAPQLVEYAFNDEGQLREMSDVRERPNPGISIIHVEGDLFFGAADLFREQIRQVCLDKSLRIVILRLRNARHLDATSVMALEELARVLHEEGRHLILSGAQRDVYLVLRNSGVLDVIGRRNFFMGSPQNPNLATRNALKRAKELLGGQTADIRIFYDPTQSRKK